MFIKANPHQEKLKEIFTYDKDGFLIWVKRDISCFSHTSKPLCICNSWNSRLAGKRAGTLSHKGYYDCQIAYKGTIKSYKLHRLIYEFHHGEIPNGMQIDHIDGNVSNNKIENLRLAEHGQNRSNSKCNANSSTKIKGLSFHKKMQTWQARVQKDGIRKERFFDDIEVAKEWLINERDTSHKEFANHGIE